MRALQEVPTVPSGSTPARASGSRPRSLPRPRRRAVRCVIGLIGGVLWWGALLRLAVHPQGAAPWQSALAAGGWSLGLIPLHAVPVRIRRPRGAQARARGDVAAG